MLDLSTWNAGTAERIANGEFLPKVTDDAEFHAMSKKLGSFQYEDPCVLYKALNNLKIARYDVKCK